MFSSLFLVVVFAIVLYVLACGVASIATGKVYGMGQSVTKYTEESLHAFAVPWGISQICLGLGLLGYDLLVNNIVSVGDFSHPLGWIILGIGVVLALIVAFISRNKLVEK